MELDRNLGTDLQPRRIELARNIGTDPYQLPDRILGYDYQNLSHKIRRKLEKVGADMSYVQSKIHSGYDSAESIADSDLEDGMDMDEEKMMVLIKNPQLQGNQKQRWCRREREVHNVLKLITLEEKA